MKVIFVNTNTVWGGGEKWHLDTALVLKLYGFEVCVLTTKGTRLYEKSVEAGIRTLPVKIKNLSFLNPFRIYSITKLFRSELPDLIILNLSSDLKTAGICARLAGIKQIVYRRGNARPVRNSISNRIIFKNIITAVIANSEETKRSVLKNNNSLFPFNKIKVLYNGLDLKRFDALEYQNIFDNKAGSIILGSAGRLSEEKGHHLLVEMALLLRKKQVSFVLLIAGEGPMKDSLFQKCRAGGLEENIIFTGFVENIKSFMQSIDIFILPSLWEGFGYVSIEAMACNKPVVAFSTGSNPEIIEDDKTGFLVNCYDTNELAEKVSLLISNQALRLAFGKAGRKKVENTFNSEITVRSTRKFIEELISQNFQTIDK
jgi:glycosyltransferase involved in cell wall biosynthesis